MTVPRRTFLTSDFARAPGVGSAPGSVAPGGIDIPSPTFPAHDPDVAREMVSVSHGNVARVRELLAGRPALANASWDWGYGDWESALGAASHVGNQEIARLLLAARRPAVHLFRRDARPPRYRQGVRRRLARHPEDAGSARPDAALARPRGRTCRRRGGQVPGVGRRRRREIHQRGRSASPTVRRSSGSMCLGRARRTG